MGDPSDQLEEARAFALAYCAQHGDPDAADRVRIDLAGSRVMFSTVNAQLCGSSISGYLRGDRQAETLSRALSRVMRQRARDRALATAAENGSPAWSMDLHVLAWVMLCNAGINPLLLATHEDKSWDGRSGFDRAVAASPISVNAEIRAGRIFTPAISIRPDAIMSADIVFDEAGANDGPPRLMLLGRSLPETAAAALAGRPLSSIVDHPLLDMKSDVFADIRAIRVANVDGNVVIDLNDDRTTLTPPPAGIEPDWLRFAWNP